MSLIERAVDRLTKPETQGTSAPAGGQASMDVIERAVAKVSPLQQEVAKVARAADPAPQPQPAPRDEPPVLKPETIRIHVESLRARGFVTPAGEQSLVAQEFRVIKRPLLANAFGKGVGAVRNGKRIMVTSAFPGEGKTFCAINLAMSIAAERDHKVMLIDADVARPSVPAELGIGAERGLMDWLLDGGDIGKFVYHTDIEKLAILPAGRRHQQATELLASGAMTNMLDQLAARFPDRILIFDSPPLLVTTESRVLASHMGQIVMVVEAGRTPREAVSEATETIKQCEVVGLLLNKSKMGPGSGYGYGYGYGYGKGI
jgi:protein-tyrosine kinase